MLGKCLRMKDKDKQEDRLCRYCGKKLPKRKKRFCNKDCQINFKEREENKTSVFKVSNRNQEYKIRLSLDEKRKIGKKADELGLKMSQYMRLVALYGIKIPSQVLL